ncbi:hypothetical protein COOONC_14030, partial [Cooperia oncophora]
LTHTRHTYTSASLRHFYLIWKHFQQCVNSIEEPGEDLKLFRSCDDPWCFAFLTAEADGGLTTVHRGCRSRKTMMHHISKDQDAKFKNNTKWTESERFVNTPSCADITWDVDYNNGTQSMCLDFLYQVCYIGAKMSCFLRLCFHSRIAFFLR